MKTKKLEFIPHIDVANEEIERLHAELESARSEVPECVEPEATPLGRRTTDVERPLTINGAEPWGLARAIAANIEQQKQRQTERN